MQNTIRECICADKGSDVMKRYLISLLVIVCVALCALLIFKISTKPQNTIITTLSVQDVTEKRHINYDYYLTLLLDDFVVEEYRLPHETLTIKTTKSIYDDVVVNSGFSGVSLKIVFPDNQEKRDLGMILKENLIDWCQVIGITTKDNVLIG